VSSVNRYVSYRPIHSNTFVSACCSSLVENGSGSIYYTHRDFLNKKVSCKPYFAESCAWAKWNLTSQLDKFSSWLVTLASGHAEWNHLTSDRLSSRLVKSTFKVTTKESHPMLLSQEPPLRGTRGGVWCLLLCFLNQYCKVVMYGLHRDQSSNQGRRIHEVTVMAKKRVKIGHILITFFGENDVFGIILRCSPPREATLRLANQYRWPWVRNLTHCKFWKILLKESIVLLMMWWCDWCLLITKYPKAPGH